jgi:hypothetical protein
MEDKKIKQPAIKLNGKVYVGNSYISIISMMKGLGIKDALSGQHGFVTFDGEFYNRKDSAEIAIKSGQTKKLKYPPLLSFEDLIK